MSLFDKLPAFGGLEYGITTRGGDAVRLSGAIINAAPEARAAAVALGDPASAARRAECLRILDALPVARQRAILTAYHGNRPPETKDGRDG